MAGDEENYVPVMTMADPLRIQRDAFSREALLESIEEADRALAREAERLPNLSGRIETWRSAVVSLLPKLEETEARVAFVGPVKSGKSTLVNALLGEDVLPRGSGVLTAQVTEVRRSDSHGLQVTWKSREAVNRAFTGYLTALGRPGRWDLGRPDHRTEASQLLAERARRSRPQDEPLRALLAGFDAIWERLGAGREAVEPADLSGLGRFVARDEVAVFVARIEALVATPDLPDGLVLLDCQGADAWHAAHARDLETALMASHALVYVVSTRVGLREADFRLIEDLRGYGLLPLTRFVLNEDLGEVRDAAELARVVEGARQRLSELGCERVWAFSALQALLDRRLLLDPDSVAEGERRLIEVWGASCPKPSSESRETFETFRNELWAEARDEGERLTLLRARADLRRTLVEAAQELRAGGASGAPLDRTVWQTDTTEKILTWAKERMDAVAQARKEIVQRTVAANFSSRKAPHREVWANRVKLLDPEPTATWREADGNPVAAAAMMRSRLEEAAGKVLSETEPLRVNAVRNLALEARGELCREGEALAGEAAGLLERAGIGVHDVPTRRSLAREITVTRKIPLFRSFAFPGSATSGTEGGRVLGALGRAAGRLGERLGKEPTGGSSIADAEAAVQKRRLLRRLQARWEAYGNEVLARCLLPHVDEAAAQVYARLASWVLTQTGTLTESGMTGALGALERDGGALKPPQDAGNRQDFS